jgi:hypothetical protein
MLLVPFHVMFLVVLMVFAMFMFDLRLRAA